MKMVVPSLRYKTVLDLGSHLCKILKLMPMFFNFETVSPLRNYVYSK